METHPEDLPGDFAAKGKEVEREKKFRDASATQSRSQTRTDLPGSQHPGPDGQEFGLTREQQALLNEVDHGGGAPGRSSSRGSRGYRRLEDAFARGRHMRTPGSSPRLTPQEQSPRGSGSPQSKNQATPAPTGRRGIDDEHINLDALDQYQRNRREMSPGAATRHVQPQLRQPSRRTPSPQEVQSQLNRGGVGAHGGGGGAYGRGGGLFYGGSGNQNYGGYGSQRHGGYGYLGRPSYGSYNARGSRGYGAAGRGYEGYRAGGTEGEYYGEPDPLADGATEHSGQRPNRVGRGLRWASAPARAEGAGPRLLIKPSGPPEHRRCRARVSYQAASKMKEGRR